MLTSRPRPRGSITVIKGHIAIELISDSRIPTTRARGPLFSLSVFSLSRAHQARSFASRAGAVARRLGRTPRLGRDLAVVAVVAVANVEGDGSR